MDDAGATAVLDLQVHRFSQLETARMRDERDQLLATIQRLRE